jgi:hypothetical protein
VKTGRARASPPAQCSAWAGRSCSRWCSVCDLVGVALSAGGLALLTYGIIDAGDAGWRDSAALAEMLGANASFYARFVSGSFLANMTDSVK